MKKIKVLVYIYASDGCNLHRLILPHGKLEKLTDDIEITWGFPKEMKNVADKIDYIGKHDIFVFHRLLDVPIDEVKSKCPNTVIIADMDDYWELGSLHSCYSIYEAMDFTPKIKECVIKSDYITTTTPILAEKIKPFNSNVKILPNALSDVVPHPVDSDRIRIGLIGGSSHLNDVELLRGVVNSFSKDELSKMQFVLCGFDKGQIRCKNENGGIESMPMPWEDNAWTKMERILSDNYKMCSSGHFDFLQKHLPMDDEFNESYRRIWARDIWSYISCYDEIDILLVPLLDNEFNKYKSELKMVEASAMGKPVIVSDVNPYKLCAINAIEKGGAINPEGNCIMVNNQKGSKAWVKAIQRIIKDTELKEMITGNISKLVEGKYNLNTVTEERISFYKDIV